MKKLLVLLTVVFLSSCSSSRVITSKEANRKYGNTSDTVIKKDSIVQEEKVVETVVEVLPNETPLNTNDKVSVYIHTYKTIAQQEMKHTGIPASITLAQGILESGAGHGDLTKRANNHFGIKCHNWTGERVYHDDDRRGECFRKYEHPAQSFKDHSEFLTSRKRYAFLFQLNRKDYTGWAKGLRKAGYATDPKYPSKLISLIERYNLHVYDSLSTKIAEQKSLNYTVQQGDTLYSIARKFNLSVSALKEKNNLSDTTISIGQQLIVQ